MSPTGARTLPAVPDFEDEDLLSDPDAPRPSKELIRIRGWLRRLVAAMELPANPLDQVKAGQIWLCQPAGSMLAGAWAKL